MKTFDEIIPEIKIILKAQGAELAKIGKFIINRDLNGRIRLLADENMPSESKKILENIAESIAGVLESRVPGTERVLYEPCLDALIQDASCFPLVDFPQVVVADRLLGESHWGNITPQNCAIPRIVFYSIKGGVGRSTALAAAAWALAEEGKKVLAIDMDLESPGISSSLLSPQKAPLYGVVDWLVEDLTDNGDEILSSIISASDLSRNGEIFVVPSHGKNPGEYVSKIGRVWMPKHMASGDKELWQGRMHRLLKQLEAKHNPDVVLIDSRAGIDEISSACITGFGVESVLLFSMDTDQTWNGYKILFDHWLKTGAVKDIRDRLQIIGALIPEIGTREYIDRLCEHSWDLFTDKVYDSVSPGDMNTDLFSFDKDDEEAPHYPRIILWNRGFEALPNIYQPFGQELLQKQVENVFGYLIEYIKGIISNG